MVDCSCGADAPANQNGKKQKIDQKQDGHNHNSRGKKPLLFLDVFFQADQPPFE